MKRFFSRDLLLGLVFSTAIAAAGCHATPPSGASDTPHHNEAGKTHKSYTGLTMHHDAPTEFSPNSTENISLVFTSRVSGLLEIDLFSETTAISIAPSRITQVIEANTPTNINVQINTSTLGRYYLNVNAQVTPQGNTSPSTTLGVRLSRSVIVQVGSYIAPRSRPQQSGEGSDNLIVLPSEEESKTDSVIYDN